MQTVAESKLIQKWDYAKNAEAGLDPSVLTCGSNKKAWWICENGHSFQREISSQWFKGTGCPICSNHLVVVGINDFRSNYPNLMLDWDYDKNLSVDPSALSVGSLTRAFWKCHICGHEWSGTIRDAVGKTINCPKCSRKEKGRQKHLFCLKQNGFLSDEELLKDWDYEKNTLLPTEVTRQTSTFVFWKCHICGYEWKAKVANRTNGRGCPCCGRKIAVSGVTDLATTHPDLAKEWHPTKNGDLKPTDVLYGSAKRIWWICPIGHEYQATLLSRSRGKTNCPICNRRKQTSFREQAIFYYVKRFYPSAISRFKPKHFGKFELDVFVPELRCAIEYDGSFWHNERFFEKEKRKYHLCKETGIKLIRIKEKPVEDEKACDLADLIISQYDCETEQGLSQAIKVLLSFISTISNSDSVFFDVNLDRDRFEIMKYATEIKHSFQDEYPGLAKTWHPSKNGTLTPSMFKSKSSFKAWWLCDNCGCEFERTIEARIFGSYCPQCALRDNTVTNPLLLNEWNYEKNGDLKPELFRRASDAKVWWKCSKCGHEWQSKISNREHRRGCPKCAGYRLFPGYNDLATVHPELLEEWDYSKNVGIDPHFTHVGSQKPVWWKCKKCGYEYQAPVARRSKTGSGCRKCADKANPDLLRAAMVRKHGSLGDVCPELLAEYSPENTTSAFEIASSSHIKVKWICSVCGHKWEASPYSRKSGHGCPICGRKKAALARTKNKKANNDKNQDQSKEIYIP